MLAIVPADDSPDCCGSVLYASVRVVHRHGDSFLLKWRDQGRKHYGLGIGGFGVVPGDMRTVRLPEEESRIREELLAQLPARDAQHRIPHTDLRRVYA